MTLEEIGKKLDVLIDLQIEINRLLSAQISSSNRSAPDMCDFPSCTNHHSVSIQYGSEDKAFCSFCAQAGLAIMLLSAQ